MSRVLVVDDDKGGAVLTKEYLELGGHTVVAICLSEEDAIARLEQLDFDVAVVDGLGGAGIFVARAVRATGRKVIGFSMDDVTFGDINVNRKEGRRLLVEKLGVLMED